MWNSCWRILVVVAVVITGQLCQAVVVLEHQETALSCNISPTAPRTSAVFWYSNTINEYLTSDFELIAELRDDAPLLYPRLSVTGSARRGKYNLHITDVIADDAGEYLCGYYSNNDEWITVKTVTVEVLTPPGKEFPACSVQSPGQTLLLPGMLVNFSCISYGGSPTADLAWYRAGVPLESIVAHDGLWVYHQRLIQEEDSGVEFTCEATSSALMEPKRCSVTPYHRAPLLYVQHVDNGLVDLGESATFTCANQREAPVPGDDGPRYRWYYNGDLAENGRSGVVTSDGGRSLTLPNITFGDNRAVVSCEKVDEFTARSSASVSIQVVVPAFPPPIVGVTNMPPSGKSDSSMSTQEPSANVSKVEFMACIIGAFCLGVLFTLVLLFVISLYCNFARKRGRLDFNKGHEISVGWKKNTKQPPDGDRHNHIKHPISNSSVLTFKKPNGAIPNGNIPVKECSDCFEMSNADEDVTDERYKPPTFASPKRCASRLNSPSKQTGSYDLLPSGPAIRKKPPALSLFNDSGRPLLSSPSPTGRSDRRLPSVDRDYISSMPDLATRHFGEPMSFPDHDYVNLPALPTSKEGSGSSTPSSYVNCEFASPVPPTSPVRKQSLKQFNSDTKSLSYAKLDLPIIGERPSIPISPNSSEATKLRAGSVSVERTKYAQIAYVFKDRRQQSLPSVKLVGLTEGFGEKV